MPTTTDYALIAGAAYFDTRAPINRFPTPIGWNLVSKMPEQTSGFEASVFGNGSDIDHSTEIVISYAGTYDKDFSGDIAADANLAQGVFTNQLLQAARYYLDVQAANPGATITLTGHSLGGGLASLIAVFFNKDAVTFDQGPFANSARSFNGHDAAATLLDQLKSLSDPNNKPYDLSGLASFIEQRQTSGSSIPILDDGLMTLHVAKMALHAANYSAWKVTA